MSKPYLVTGGRGFLAPHLIAELKRRHPGARIAVTHRRNCDLLDAPAVSAMIRRLKPAVVFHLAGTTKALSWDGLWDAHVRATMNLMEALRAPGGAKRVRLVLLGSAGEYGAPTSGRRVLESDPARPVTVYGSTKLSQTLAAMSFRGEKLEVSVARVFNAIGPGIPDRLAVGAFCSQLALIERGRQDPLLAVGNLKTSRDFLDVRDVARALADIGDKAPPGIYNVCSGHPVPIGRVLEDLIALTGLDVKVRPAAARRRAADIARIAGSHRRLTAATGWRPSVTLAQSLADTLQWYRRQ